MEPSVMDQRANVFVQKDGKESIVGIEHVRTIYTAPTVTKLVSVKMRIQKVVIHGMVFVTANLVGAQFYVIVHVRF